MTRCQDPNEPKRQKGWGSNLDQWLIPGTSKTFYSTYHWGQGLLGDYNFTLSCVFWYKRRMALQTYRRFSGSLISWVYGEISWVISFFRKFYLPSWNKKLEVVNCDFKLSGDRYLPMVFPEFVIILNEVPPTFNTWWDATGWPKSLQRSLYKRGVLYGIQKISRVCVHLSHRSLSNKLYEYNRLERCWQDTFTRNIFFPGTTSCTWRAFW